MHLHFFFFADATLSLSLDSNWRGVIITQHVKLSIDKNKNNNSLCVCSFVCQSINRWSASSIPFVNHNYKYKNTGCFQLAPVISSKVDLLQKKKAVRVLIVILKTDNLRNARAKLDSILGTLQYCFFFRFCTQQQQQKSWISSRQRNDFASVFIWEGAVARHRLVVPELNHDLKTCVI